MAAGRTSTQIFRIETALKEERRTVAEREHRSIANWMDYPIGRTGFHLSVSMNSRERYIRVDL